MKIPDFRWAYTLSLGIYLVLATVDDDLTSKLILNGKKSRDCLVYTVLNFTFIKLREQFTVFNGNIIFSASAIILSPQVTIIIICSAIVLIEF